MKRKQKYIKTQIMILKADGVVFLWQRKLDMLHQSNFMKLWAHQVNLSDLQREGVGVFKSNILIDC